MSDINFLVLNKYPWRSPGRVGVWDAVAVSQTMPLGHAFVWVINCIVYIIREAVVLQIITTKPYIDWFLFAWNIMY